MDVRESGKSTNMTLLHHFFPYVLVVANAVMSVKVSFELVGQSNVAAGEDIFGCLRVDNRLHP